MLSCQNQATLLCHTNLQQMKQVGIAVVKTQHISIIKTAINIQKTCIPPGIPLLLGDKGTSRATTAST